MKKIMICALLSSAVFAASCGQSQLPEEPGPVVRPAKLFRVERATTERSLSYPAVIQAVDSAELTFQIAGEIIELNALEGEGVTKGQVLARLNQRDVQNQVAQAQAQFDNAEAEFTRAQRLASQNAISRSVLETRQTNRDVALAALDSAKKALGDTILRSPFDGGISRVHARRFQNVQAKEPILDVQTREVEAVINIPGDIVAIMPQLIPVGAEVRLDADPDRTISAEFREASGVADTSTQTYQVTFSFIPPEDLLILPGMTATVTTSLDIAEASRFTFGAQIPGTAILSDAGQTYVWVVDPQTSKVSRRKVEVNSDFNEYVVVSDGLEPDETIVAAGVAFFSDGMTIREWQPK